MKVFSTEITRQVNEFMMMKKINYSITEEFNRDFKQLFKKYKSLNEDLDLLKTRILEPFHIGVEIEDNGKEILFVDTNAIKVVPGFENEEFTLYKVTKFVCKSLKSRGSKSGIRIIYAYYETETSLELVQMYFKADNENMDYERARKYMRTILNKNEN